MGLNIADLDQIKSEVNEMRMDNAEIRQLTKKIAGYAGLYAEAIALLTGIDAMFDIPDDGQGNNVSELISDLLDRVEAYEAMDDASPTS